MGFGFQLPHCCHYICAIGGGAGSSPSLLRGELFWSKAEKFRARGSKLTQFFHPWRALIPAHTCVGGHPFPIPGQCSSELLFVVMPATDGALEVIQDYRDRKQIIIVDIVADVFQDVDPLDTDPSAVAAGNTTSPEAWDHWHSEEIQGKLSAAIDAATVITTSWAYLLNPLRKRVNHSKPVIHLPDLRGDDWSTFGLNFKHVYWAAEESRG